MTEKRSSKKDMIPRSDPVLEHNRIKGTATKHSILQCIVVLLLLHCIPCESWVGMQQNRVNCYRKKSMRGKTTKLSARGMVDKYRPRQDQGGMRRRMLQPPRFISKGNIVSNIWSSKHSNSRSYYRALRDSTVADPCQRKFQKW